ncbi:uncharacterized protein ATNIH1004_007962 [Aspergillus tanneri]|uniref:Uncharacterized protein n=1 Tax=Aspergillus tanneri TaxID=1220188 RepID=A0A5M9MPQ5_9EURO|nr:uncharacterized protein ATNIH1004_007962 [Aspergillus tanneri]KAA8646529.1 hypothetical protein ATNIH1004_007962 [Aspergillus tanneri]
MAIGSAFAAKECTLIGDQIYRRLVKKKNGVGKSEFQTPIMVERSDPVTLIMPNIEYATFSAEAMFASFR